MITYLKRNEVNISKYDECIKNASNTRIYAYSYYLDIVCNNWSVLIMNDYEYVMPLPWKQKFLIKYIYNPQWLQQLGVFSSKNVISKEIIKKFITAIPKTFFKVSLNFNSENSEFQFLIKRRNYILPLNLSYNELFKNYKYIRRRTRNLLENTNIIIDKSEDFHQVIDLFKAEKQNIITLKNNDYQRLIKLIIYLKKNNKVDIVVAKTTEGEFLGGAFFLKDDRRITYLFSSITSKGRDQQAMTFIIDSIIEKYANQNLILDFEGSMMPGIAFFFKSFGAVEEIYFNYQKSFLSF